MENNLVITKPHQAAAGLAELAVKINVAHGNVETAFRDGLCHARQAGTLLLQAKAIVPHGSWLTWVQENCQATPRTVQRYMQVAEHWEEIVTKGGETLGMHGALKLLTHERNDSGSSNTTRASHLPPALAHFYDGGLVNDDALAQLLGLAKDYGPEVLTILPFSKTPILPGGEWLLLNAIRPLDHPSLWPFPRSGIATPGTAAVATATRIFIENGQSRGDKVPQWEVTAFWFASTMVHLGDASPPIARQFASHLHHALSVWRESFRTALFIVALLPHDYLNDDMLWMGYHSDLRHAGAVQAAEEMVTNPDLHPALYQSAEAGLAELDRLGSYPLPSGWQKRLDRSGDGETVAEDACEQPVESNQK